MALNNDDYNDILRKHLSSHFDVISNSVYDIKYLYEFIDNYHPDIIVVHDQYFGLDAETEIDREIEWLKNVEYIRRKYDDAIRFVFLCERPEGDPFLSELVSRNVLDIFHNRNIDLQLLIEQLQNNPKYSKVAYLVVKGSTARYKDEEVYVDLDEEEEIVQNVNEPEQEEFQSPLITLGFEESLKREKQRLQEEKVEKVKREGKFYIPKLPTHLLKGSLSFKKEDKNVNENEGVKGKKTKTKIRDEKSIKEEKNKKVNKPLINIQRNIIQSSNVVPKLIAIGSIHPGAGSTFFIHNFSRFLSDGGIACSVIEAFNTYDALYHLFSAEQDEPENWESLHYYISKGFRNVSTPRWKIDDITVFPQKNADIKEIDVEIAKEVIFIARQSPIVLVDISHNWDDPISKVVLSMCDELWCITEPNPYYIRACEQHYKYIYQVSKRVGENNVIVIGNRWEAGIEPEFLPEIYTQIPFFKENVKALNKGVPLYSIRPKYFKVFNKLEDRLYKD